MFFNWLNYSTINTQILENSSASCIEQHCFLSVSSGIHILQSVSGCEWDESTGEMINFLRYAYNGEDFLEFDMKTLRWIVLKPEAVITKQRWDTDENRIKYTVKFLSTTCPKWLKMSLESGKHSLQRTGTVT